LGSGVSSGPGGFILGTAGHIDHGKTALVEALTGTDTDRLREEKARGITIELGFAELAVEGGPRFGVVDVPGHEAFVRAMVAGAAGMDVVLLVVAADEGVMPQTREHLAIVELLDVAELVVALTKCDAVEADWLELVHADVEELLAETRYAGARRVETSATERTGLDELVAAVIEAAGRARASLPDDLVRLPLDRVFTIQGTGTVVTGTLWSGSVASGDRVRILPQGLEARVRSIEVHGQSEERADAGQRVALALTGAGSDRDVLARGSTLVIDPVWMPSWMLTTRVELLADTAWSLEHNQRVHVHHGTAEVLARCALLETEPLSAGGRGWVQLRLEEPLAARAGDRLVLRAYSPVTTIGGGVVAEPEPPKRNRLEDEVRGHLETIVEGQARDVLVAALELGGWLGVAKGALPLRTGLTPAAVESALAERGAGEALEAGGLVFGRTVLEEAARLALAAVEAGHAQDSLRPAVPLAAVRAALPSWAAPELADGVIGALVAGGRLVAEDGGVRLPDFEPRLTPDQEAATEALMRALTADGLAAPLIDELPEELRRRGDLWSLIRRLEAIDRLRLVADGLYVAAEELDRAAARIHEALAGRTGLGPADFREVLPVTRKHLIPLLNYFDGRGTTLRGGEGRDVPP
jgi:selenocysteine-specific elongation factor